jgi:hypothetical protein
MSPAASNGVIFTRRFIAAKAGIRVLDRDRNALPLSIVRTQAHQMPLLHSLRHLADDLV